MKLKNKLILILLSVFSLFLLMEFIGGEFYFDKIFKYTKIKNLENVDFIKGDIINYKKLKLYQENKNAFVIILDKNKILNLDNFDYLTLKSESGNKIFLLNAFLDNLYSNSSFHLNTEEEVNIKYVNFIGDYYIPISIKNKNKKYIDYKLGNFNLKKHETTGTISSINSAQLTSSKGDDALEILLQIGNFTPKNIEYTEADGDKAQVIIKNIGAYKVIIFYSYENLNDIIPTLRLYFYIKILFLILTILILGKIIDKIIIDPITKLSTITDAIGKLKFKKYISYERNDEIGDLYKKLSTMSLNLKEIISLYKEELYKNGVKTEELEERIKGFMHEVKTPLSAIIGFSEYLKEINPSEEIDIIHLEGKRLLRLSEETLSLEYEDKNKYNFEYFNISNLIDLGSKIFEKEIGNRNLVLKNISDIKIFGDREKIEQVIFNLIKNSTEYACKEIEIEMKKENNLLYLFIRNDGPHIKENNLNNIWNKFYSEKNIKGRGLGLFITKEILDAHKSNYGVKNLEKGVEFYFSLMI